MKLLARIAATLLIVSCCDLVECISNEGMKNIKGSFELYDTNGDGGISIMELDIVMRYLQQSPSAEQLKTLFKSVDMDNSGKINFSEFCVLMGVSTKPLPTAKADNEESIVEKSFSMFDIDGNGVISLAELDQLMQFLDRRYTKLELVKILRSVDKDNSGTIDLSEFQYLLAKTATSREEQSVLHKRFAQIDSDGNGFISFTEMYYELTKGEEIALLHIKSIFTIADGNSDGLVDFEEFVKMTQ